MGKRANKRQKLERQKGAAIPAQPLGSQVASCLLNDAGKDDEERRLESMLFGTKYVPAPVDEDQILVVPDDDNEDVNAGQELQGLMDTDVRIFTYHNQIHVIEHIHSYFL